MQSAVFGKRPLLPLFFTVFIDLIGIGIVFPVLAVVLLEPTVGIVSADTPIETRKLLYGLLVAVFPLFQFFGSPVLGALSDHHGRKPLLLLSFAGTLVGYALFALGLHWGRLDILFLSRALAGFTGGNIAIAMSALADMSKDTASKTRNFGLIGMAFGLGFILGPVIGGKLSDPGIVSWFSMETPFWFAASVTALNMVFLWLFLPETLRNKLTTRVSLLTGVRNVVAAMKLSNLRTVFIVMFLLTLGFNFFAQFFQIFLIEKYSFTTSQIGNIFGYIGMWIAITQGVVTGPVARRFSAHKVLSFSILGLACIFPILLIPNDPWWLYIFLPFIALFQGLTQPNATTIISELADADSQGEIMGINQSVQSLGQTLPPVIAGIVSALHPSFPIVTASVITLVAWLVFTVAFFGKKKEVFHEVS